MATRHFGSARGEALVIPDNGSRRRAYSAPRGAWRLDILAHGKRRREHYVPCGARRREFVSMVKGLRESSASLGAGRGEFLSTVNDNGNRRPRVRRHAGDFCPR
jgi:hypothetical protein